VLVLHWPRFTNSSISCYITGDTIDAMLECLVALISGAD
jgi:hypothetical protein